MTEAKGSIDICKSYCTKTESSEVGNMEIQFLPNFAYMAYC